MSLRFSNISTYKNCAWKVKEFTQTKNRLFWKRLCTVKDLISKTIRQTNKI